MPVSLRNLFHQGPVLSAMVAAATTKPGSGEIIIPGPEYVLELPPRPQALVADYLTWLGVSPRRYKGVLPPHLFPQWGMSVVAKSLTGLPFPLSKVVNGGCQLTVNAPLPADEPLTVRGRLVEIDDNERRTILYNECTTSTPSAPDALVARMQVIIRKPRPKDAPRGKKKTPALVPLDAREVAASSFHARSGWEFALLTGDFNPIHWIPAAGRAAGFGGCILHGFGTMAMAWEGLVDGVLSGDASGVAGIHVRFASPLKLPGKVGLFVDGDDITVGKAPGATAVLTGTWSRR
jgi:acyl dehydratase